MILQTERLKYIEEANNSLAKIGSKDTHRMDKKAAGSKRTRETYEGNKVLFVVEWL